MVEEKRFILYEYLYFFWKKKIYLLLIPILIAFLVGLVSWLSSPGYEGKVSFYVGSIKHRYLTDPDLIKANFEDELKTGSLKVNVIANKKIQFTVIGNDRKEVEPIISNIATKYKENLIEQSRLLKEKTKADIEEYENEIKMILQTHSHILNNNVWEDTNYGRLTLALVRYGEMINSNKGQINRMENDLIFFEEPMEYAREFGRSKGNVLPNTVLSYFISLFLSILLIMLWKYIDDAKKAIK